VTGAARRPGIRALGGVVTCAALLITDGGQTSASCPASCPAPAGWGQSFSFAGLTWERKNGCGGPGPNCWEPANVTLQGDGVHLRLTRQSGMWYSAEIRTTAPVPTGSYAFQLVGRSDLLDPNVVLGTFLYDDAAGEAADPCPAELDLESSRFGDPLAPNGHFATYGSSACGAADWLSFSYVLTGDFTTHRIDWSPGVVTYSLLHGHRCSPEIPQHLIARRTFASPLVPAAGGMRLHVNLWAFAGQAPTDQQEVEVVIRDVVTTCTAVAAATGPGETGWELAVRRAPTGDDTDIRFSIPEAAHLRVTIVDASGRLVTTLLDAELPAGIHAIRWGDRSVAAGVYFVRVVCGGHVLSRRTIVLR
jgi:hypothetical protein